MIQCYFQIYKKAALQHRSQNFVMSSYNVITVLSTLLLGSRGRSSDDLANFLRADDFVNFNPHLLLKNLNEELIQSNVDSNIAFADNIFVEKVGLRVDAF